MTCSCKIAGTVGKRVLNKIDDISYFYTVDENCFKGGTITSLLRRYYLNADALREKKIEKHPQGVPFGKAAAGFFSAEFRENLPCPSPASVMARRGTASWW